MNTVNEARKKHWRKMLDYLVENGIDHMTEWEQNYVDELSIRFEGEDVELTFKQSSCLAKIYEKVVERVG